LCSQLCNTGDVLNNISSNETENIKSNISILLVEDSIAVSKTISRLLKLHGHDVELALNGAVALEFLINKSYSFDLILMDLEMPVMNGYETARLYREYEQRNSLARLPIIAISANDVVSVFQSCLEASMDDFLPKPFVMPELVLVLRKFNLNI
jgi:CheY-like chemotaxis protein